ncbi:MAG: LytTR family transcriptional regulator DNA-binding domain-containing protein [Bacillota bacterium]|nr:LytTR family transcriptional regulator DNA-binding domain-containing protein [Bacillota bacterium]MDD3299009.1 LytTR family transcriptional regulator DNA-binding domain-containing protein [Bacillota bacterium]MDD3851332.1 LytTR family transcriptional regulator DNA-binding domain-containing protein [Bacillota bacterium]MDD4707567.1 LytTR family transcriptional regulator DNA-binding domain-containing protein [Bacillota bacterium]
MIRVLIADDEAPAREELSFLISRLAGFQVIGVASSGSQAVFLIKELHPQVVFLDIQMPGLNGLEVSKALASLDPKPLIVFVTAYDEYALNAFDVEAVDYLLKPVSDDRLFKTAKRLKELLQPRLADRIKTLLSDREKELNLKRIPVEKNGRIRLLEPREILCFFADQGYIIARTGAGDFITNFTLNELEERIERNTFFRCHKSYIVNLDYIKEIIPWTYSSYKLIMHNNDEIPVSRQKSKDLATMLGL